MIKTLFLKQIFLIIFLAVSTSSISQVAGDFQTKTPSGNWSNFNSWNIYNGSAWIAAISGQLPTASSNVYVQATHIISVDNSIAVCNTLYVNGSSSSKIAFTSPVSILNIKGDMVLFSTSHDCFSAWTPGARIIFSGAGSQGFINLSAITTFIDIEINKVAGAITTSSHLRFGKFTLTAGNFFVGSGNEIQGTSSSATISINGGVWDQTNSTTRIFDVSLGNTFPIGAVTINGGSMILATTTGSGGFQFSTISVINTGTLTLNSFTGLIKISNSINIDPTSVFNTALSTTPLPTAVTFDGVVNYNHTGSQTIFPATYSYLKLSGTGMKTLGVGTMIIPDNGTIEMSGVATSPTLSLGGTLSVSSIGTNLIYSSTGSQTASANEWNSNFQNITINNTSATGVNMAGLNRSILGSLNLNNGVFDIGANGTLTLSGAPLNKINGYITGTSTSDLAVTGTTGGTILLPLSGNISLRNITISGTRIMAMDGINHINLYGTFDIGSTAVYDNGGESQIQKGISAPASITISGKFLNRDKDDFANTNGAIPGINPTLGAASTIEFGLSGAQFFTARTDYKNITFSGSGTKTPSGTFTPNGTLTITGNAILDAINHNIGDGVPGTTNFIMNGGRLILGTTTPTTQPQMNGLYNLTGGVVEFAGSNATTQGIRSLKNYYAIEVTGTNVGNSSGNINLNHNGSFTVKTNGIFMINADAIDGSFGTQTVTVEAGGIFKCGNNEGFNGFASTFLNYSSLHQNIENIILMPGSLVEYSRAGDQPITTFNGLVYQNLAISGSGNKIAPAGILTVQGNLTKSGTSSFVPGSGIVLLNGNAQSFAGLTYNNLILSKNNKTTQGSSTILDSIKVNTATTLSVSPSDTVIIHSDATKSGRVAQVDGSISNASRFTVERFISSRRAWRFLAVATQSSQTIKNAWQEGALTLASNPRPGYGTQLQINNAAWMSNGFDAQSINGPSIKTYNYITDSYNALASTLNPFDASLGGYMTFIRGDRTATYFGAPVTKTVLRTTGNLFTGNQPIINILYGKVIPVNNPYASPIDLRKLSSSYNVFYYVWDPNRGGTYGLGAIQTLSWNGSGYDVVPGNSGSYGLINNFIESGQAFFASTLGADTTVQITEGAKVSTTPSVIPFVPATNAMHLHTNLHILNTDGSTILSDGVLASFATNYSNGIDGMDAKKLANNGENLSLKSHNELLVVERRSAIVNNDTLFLELTGTSLKQYRFELIANNLDQPDLNAYLEDNYLNTRIPINLSGTTFADFVIDPADIFSSATDRFRIILDLPAANALAVTLTNVNAYKKNENVSVEWTISNEDNIKQYDVEKSADGNLFNFNVTLIAKNLPFNTYKWLDEDALTGYNYYRIKIVNAGGEIKYSKIVKVLMGERKQEITVYPNPVKNGIINLQLINQPAGAYRLKLVNNLGQTILQKQINHSMGTSTEKISIGKKGGHGIYSLEIIRPGAGKIIRKILY